ncbi:MAG: MlaD family protein [Kiloniellales bacterium]|nr:MlaD family protein [Kiloniellales bacterium]
MAKANPRTVGGFVLGAVALAVAAVAVFGTGRFFETRDTVVSFFSGSLMGLRVGAPVEMRGVLIGTVTDLWVEVDPETLEFTFPVLMEIQQSRIRGIAEVEEDRLDELIDDGLRAQLATQSLVTGQQSIQMQFLPETEVEFVETTLPYDQIPTVPSVFEQIESDVSEVMRRANILLDRVNDILSDDNRSRVGTILDNLTKTTTELEQGIDSLNRLVEDAQEVVLNVKNTDPKIQRLLDTANGTLERYGALAERSTALVEENRKGMKDFTTTGLYELTNLAVDAQGAIEQFRRVMEEMERDPARFFLGRPAEVEVQ